MRILIHTILVTVCFVAALGLTQLRAQEKAVEMYFHVAKAPLLGARFNPDFASFGFMAAGPSQAYKAYRVEAKGIQLIVGVDDRKRVCWIQTIDRRFESPEGLRTGDALARVLSKSVEKVRTNIGWGWYVRLPSGWNAMVNGSRTPSDSAYSFSIPTYDQPDVPENATVVGFFQRR